MNNIFGVKVMDDYIRMCHDGVRQGWHERNGGNLTYRMMEEEVAECRPYFKAEPGPWVELGVQAENLQGEYFISTGSGKFLQNVGLEPQNSICIVEINDKGDSYAFHEPLCEKESDKRGKPCHLPCSYALCNCTDLRAAFKGRSIYQNALEERDGVLCRIPRRCGRCTLDGSRWSRNR